MQDFKVENDKEREFYNQDFSVITELLNRIRTSIVNGKSISISDLDFSGIVNFISGETLVYITLFQEGQKSVRYGSKRASFEATINRDIEMLRKNKRFNAFNVSDSNKCRIMIEYVCSRKKILRSELNSQRFDNGRLEIGVDGLELRKDGISYYYMPTDAITNSHMGLRNAL